MASRYLFLDFDGVLHPADAHFSLETVKVPQQQLRAAGLFEHVDMLSVLLVAYQDVRLVVHSSWRLTHSDAELQYLLGPLGERLHGATNRSLDRQESIIDFVARHDLGLAQYRILDDQVHLLPDLSDAVIQCDSRLGISEPHALLQLRAWLERPDLHAIAAATFQTIAEADSWLRCPHPMLNGMTPLECAASEGGERRVRDLLKAIKFGVLF